MLAIAPQRLPVDHQIDHAVARLDTWFQTMRGERGYGGPVTHWRQQSLIYTGPGRDWRYEGIIAGYLELWQHSGQPIWLERAQSAGDDLLAGQMSDGHFAASAFEANPASAGSPHEAACDIGLLLLAQALRANDDPTWEIYAGSAEHNLRGHYIARLWDVTSGSFGEHAQHNSFVANKAATICEALFLLAELRGEAVWAEHYALPTLNTILDHQVREAGPLEGAITQHSLSGSHIQRYFPFFAARCIPALLQGYRYTQAERYLDAAQRTMHFIERWVGDDGAPPLSILGGEQSITEPRLVAPLGDILRAAELLAAYGIAVDLNPMHQRLLAGQDASGGIILASNTANEQNLPDLCHVMHVAGWCDKAFRYLASHASPELPSLPSEPVITACTYHGRSVELYESAEVVEVRYRNQIRYRWRKGQSWAEIAEREFWMR